MSRIPAVLLQQFVGMSDYERTLAIDRASRELGLPKVRFFCSWKNFNMVR